MRLKVIFQLGSLLLCAKLLTGCSQVQESSFGSISDAKSGIDINIRWLLQYLPESSRDFRQATDFTSSYAQVVFSFDGDSKFQLHERCTKISLYEYFPQPPLNPSWWAINGIRAEDGVFRCGQGESSVFVTMIRESGKGYLWALGHG